MQELGKHKSVLVLNTIINAMPDDLNVLNDLVELINLVGQFFGPIFLAAFSSIFICTTVQIYYCYAILQSFDEEKNRSMWTLMASLNIVIIHVVLILAITSISEMIYNQVISDLLDNINLDNFG